MASRIFANFLSRFKQALGKISFIADEDNRRNKPNFNFGIFKAQIPVIPKMQSFTPIEFHYKYARMKHVCPGFECILQKDTEFMQIHFMDTVPFEMDVVSENGSDNCSRSD